jgi:hypothetical protein
MRMIYQLQLMKETNMRSTTERMFGMISPSLLFMNIQSGIIPFFRPLKCKKNIYPEESIITGTAVV